MAFLRAINTGNRRVKADRLVEVFEGLGFEGVSSYQASGNVLFAAATPAATVIEQALEAELGYEVPTVLRPAKAVQDIAASRPFTDQELEASQRRAQVILVRNAASSDTLKGAVTDVPAEDLVRPHGRDLFWLPRAGISESTLDLGAIERNLGPVTVRTHGTMRRLVNRL